MAALCVLRRHSQQTRTGLSACCHAQVHDGYPAGNFLLRARQQVYIAYDPVTRLVKANTSDIYPLIGSVQSVPPPSAGARRLTQSSAFYQFTLRYVVRNVFIGDLLAVRPGCGCGCAGYACASC